MTPSNQIRKEKKYGGLVMLTSPHGVKSSDSDSNSLKSETLNHGMTKEFKLGNLIGRQRTVSMPFGPRSHL